MTESTRNSDNFLVSNWSIIWIVATVAGPVAVMWMMPASDPRGLMTWIIRSVLVLHLIASFMIARSDPRGTRRVSLAKLAWLVFGGWLLMLGVYTIGCAVTWDFGQWPQKPS